MIVLLIYQIDFKNQIKRRVVVWIIVQRALFLLRGVNKKYDEDGLRWDKSIFRLIRELPL